MTAQGLAQDEEYEGKVFVVDNGHVSTPLHRSVLDAVEMAEAGYSAVEIKKILEETKEYLFYQLVVEKEKLDVEFGCLDLSKELFVSERIKHLIDGNKFVSVAFKEI